MTILREHCQGLNEMMWVLPTGGVDPRKHATRLEAAQAELSEEVWALLPPPPARCLSPVSRPACKDSLRCQ